MVIERDPDSQGKEWSLWLGMVILMDTRLPSRQREGAVFGEEGAQAVREVMRTIHPLSDISDTGEVTKKKKKVLKYWKRSLKWVNHSEGKGALAPNFSCSVKFRRSISLLFWRSKDYFCWNASKVSLRFNGFFFLLNIMQPEKSFSKMCVCVCTQAMLEETVERTSSWPQPSPTLMDPLRSTSWPERTHRNRFYTARPHPHLLLPTAPLTPNLPLVIQQSFPWWPTQPKTQRCHLGCMCSAGTTSAVLLLQHQTISCVLNVPPSSHIFLKAEYYQCSYQSFSFHREFSLTF